MKVKSVEALRKFIYDTIDEMCFVYGINNDKEIRIPFIGGYIDKVFIEDKNLPDGCAKFTDHLIRIKEDGGAYDGYNCYFYCLEDVIHLELTDGKYGKEPKKTEHYYIDVTENFLNIFTSKNGKGYFESSFFKNLEEVSNRTMLMVDIVNWMNREVNR